MGGPRRARQLLFAVSVCCLLAGALGFLYHGSRRHGLDVRHMGKSARQFLSRSNECRYSRWQDSPRTRMAAATKEKFDRSKPHINIGRYTQEGYGRIGGLNRCGIFSVCRCFLVQKTKDLRRLVCQSINAKGGLGMHLYVYACK